MTELEKPNSPWAYAWDRFFDTVDVIVAKVTSGKFIATILVIWTYCAVINTCCKLVEIKVISAETFLALVAGIAGLATMLCKDYFNRDMGGSNGKNNSGSN